jgi:hypothetical protein
MSWRSYVPMSFIVDTGCTIGFELSEKAIHSLVFHGRMPDRLVPTQVSKIFGNSESDKETCRRFEATIAPVRANLAPASVIGLGVLSILGLVVHKNDLGFSLGSNISWI